MYALMSRTPQSRKEPGKVFEDTALARNMCP